MTTTASVAADQGRHRLDRLFRPRSVAVVGASPKGGYGLTTLQNLRQGGFAGRLYVVHPTLEEVDGVAAYPNLSALPEVPDAVAVAVPAKIVPGVLAEAADLGAGGAVVFASGFAEVGGDGADLQQQIVDTCGGRLPVIGPNCLGLASYRGRAALWGITLPFTHAGADGRLAIAAQSGNMSLTTMFSGRLPAVAYGASLGNQAVLDIADCLDYYLSDPGVSVVALIMEGLRDLPRFRTLAERAARQDVTIVALKVGRSSLGEAATVAHTGTLAGSDAAYDALFAQTGVIRVDDLDELIAVSTLLAAPQRLGGRTLGIFASSGGECGLAADLAEKHGVEMAQLDEDTARTLRTVLPDYGYVTNPFDLTAGGWGQLPVYETAAKALAGAPGVDIVAFVGDASPNSGPLEDSGWPEMVEGAGRATSLGVPVALVTTTTDTNPALAALCAEHGVLLLPGMSTAFRAIGLVGERTTRLATASTGEPAVVAPLIDSAGSDLVDRVLGEPGTLSETDAKDVLTAYGLGTPAGAVAATPEEAATLATRLGFPVVVKIEANGLAHKSDIGGVEVGLADAEQVRAAAERVLAAGVAAVGAEAVTGVRVEVLASLKDGVELIVGGRNDASGSVVVVGAGGVLTELLADAGTLLWPFDAADVRRTLDSLRVVRLLDGYRGAPPVDRDAVVAAVLSVGRLLAERPEIAELDVNPLLCTLAGAIALDALIHVRNTDPLDG